MRRPAAAAYNRDVEQPEWSARAVAQCGCSGAGLPRAAPWPGEQEKELCISLRKDKLGAPATGICCHASLRFRERQVCRASTVGRLLKYQRPPAIVPTRQVRVELYDTRRTKFISAHNSSLAALALSNNGKLLATASEKGTLVRREVVCGKGCRSLRR